MEFKSNIFYFPSAPTLRRRPAESPPARSLRPTTTALCPATVTDPGLRARAAIQLGDSAPADSTSSGAGAQSVLRDSTASPTADVSQAPPPLPLRFACGRLSKCLLSPLCSVRVRPPPVRRGDGKMHLPPSDGEALLRRVPGPDLQLPPPAGLRRLRMLSDRNQRRHEARLRPPHGTVQVCGSTVCAGVLGF